MPAVGGLLIPPETVNKVESAEYIELKIASKDDGLLLSSSSNTFVFKVNSPSLSVLTPKLDRYTLVAPKPDKGVVVSASICFFNPLITVSFANAPFSLVESPLKVLALRTFFRSLIEVTKVCKFVVAVAVSTDEVIFAVVLVVEIKFTV